MLFSTQLELELKLELSLAKITEQQNKMASKCIVLTVNMFLQTSHAVEWVEPRGRHGLLYHKASVTFYSKNIFSPGIGRIYVLATT